MRSWDRPSKSSTSVFFPSSVSKTYSFSTGTHGSSCRCFASSSSISPSSCSRSCSASRAADHSSRVPTLCFGIALLLPGVWRSRPTDARKVIALLLDRAADLPKVLPEGVGRIGGATGQVVVEGRLRAQRLAGAHPPRLLALGLPDPRCRGQHRLDALGRDEQDAVLVGEDDVVAAHLVRPEAGGLEGLGSC